MPCRDHGISLRDFLAGLFRGPLGGLLIHRGKYSPRPLRSLPLRIPARFSRRLFPWSLGGLPIHRGKDSPRPLRSLTLRIPANLSQAYSVVPGGIPIHRGKAAGLRCLFLSVFKTDLCPSYCSVPAWTIFEPGGTSWVSQMLPPMMLSWPIVTLPRIEVFEYTVTLSSRIG